MPCNDVSKKKHDDDESPFKQYESKNKYTTEENRESEWLKNIKEEERIVNFKNR